VRITRIESQKRRPGRKNIYVDGAFLAGASDEAVLRLGLRSGDEISPETLERLLQTESYLTARATALRLLAVRPRSVQEIRERLRKKSLPLGDIEEVIADLEKASLLDDRAFARAFIRDRTALKASGPTLLRTKLLRLGVAPEILEEAIAQELGAVDLDLLALQAAQAYLRRQPTHRSDRADPALRRRTASHLARRGFSWETITRVLRRALAEDSGGDDE
jgi:regulatory protein